jgi:hypothetical protein
MAALDPDGPCYAIFHCDSSLDCDTHIELEFYTSKTQPRRIDIFFHYVGANDSPVTPNASLNAIEGICTYSIVLPICKEYTAMGRHIIVRAAV